MPTNAVTPLFGTGLPAPLVNAISPAWGPIAGGTVVQVLGVDIVSGATVKIGGVACTGVVFGDATLLTATTAAKAFGLYDVVITNPDAQTATLPASFQYTDVPTIGSIADVAGLTPGGYPVVITGTNFYAPATVLFGAVPAASLTVDSPTQITAWPAPQNAGVVDVTVSTPVGQATLAASYTISVPAYP